MITKTKTKKWGNSIGIVIPKETIESMRIKLGESIVIDIQKKESVLRELFGSLKFKTPTKKLLGEVRRDLEGKWMKK